MNITAIIEKKMKEHQFEIDGCNKVLPDLQIEVKRAIAKNKHDVPVYAQKVMIIKDKMTFHKACLWTLLDLKQEIESSGKSTNG